MRASGPERASMSTRPSLSFPPAEPLGTAVIAASRVPLLLLDDTLVVIAASRSFGEVFDLDMAHVTGLPLASLGSGEWGSDHLRLLLAAVIAGEAPLRRHEINLLPKGRPNRRLSLDAEALGDIGERGGCLLLTITDLTGIRARETRDRARQEDKDILLQELQHRTANSLQIISSVLMQNARRMASPDVRGYLEDAHHRILAVAAVQSHLAAARTSEVRLRAYLTTLCRSIAASMIHDPVLLSLEVDVDESIVDADSAMSIGLIVTELVINALKHAFPDRRPGRITVRYTTTDTGWTLLIADNGVGIGSSTSLAPPGLGTGIVEALARKLHARVLIAFGGPGTRVSVSH